MSVFGNDMTTLGIDIGTTRVKVILRDSVDGTLFESVSAPTPTVADRDGDRRDPNHVFSTVVELIGRLLGQVPKAGATVRGVSAACVGEELVYMDAVGQAVDTHRCWYAPGETPESAPGGPMNQHASWYPLRADWLQRRPQRRAAVAVTDLGSWVLMRLCAGVEPVIDRSHASRTGLLDEQGQWSRSRLESCGMTGVHMPTMIRSGDLIGHVSQQVSQRTGLSHLTEVRAGGHDHLCAALAAGIRRPGEVFISVGTSETQLMVLDAAYADLVPLERQGLEIGYFTRAGLTYLHAAQPSGRKVAEIVEADPSGRSIQAVYEGLSAVFDANETWPKVLDTGDQTVAQLWTELNRQATHAEAITGELEEVSGRASSTIVVTGVPTRHHVWRLVRQHGSSHHMKFDLRDELSGLGAAWLAQPDIEPIMATKKQEQA